MAVDGSPAGPLEKGVGEKIEEVIALRASVKEGITLLFCHARRKTTVSSAA